MGIMSTPICAPPSRKDRVLIYQFISSRCLSGSMTDLYMSKYNCKYLHVQTFVFDLLICRPITKIKLLTQLLKISASFRTLLNLQLTNRNYSAILATLQITSYVHSRNSS